MEKILVCKKVRLGQDGGKFKENIIAATERKRILVNESEFKRGNANWENSGRLYVLDEKATEAREKIVASRDNTGNEGGEEIDVLRKILDEKGVKYDKRSGIKRLTDQIEQIEK